MQSQLHIQKYETSIIVLPPDFDPHSIALRLAVLERMFQLTGVILPHAEFITHVRPPKMKRSPDELYAVTVIPYTFDGDLDKRMFSELIHNLGKQLDALAYQFCCESWTVSLEDDEIDLTTVVPSEHENRVENVFTVIEYRDAPQEVWTANIVRESDKPPSLAKWKSLNGDGNPFLGRFCNVLAPLVQH